MTSGDPRPAGQGNRQTDEEDHVPPAVGVYDRPANTLTASRGMIVGLIALILIVALLAVIVFVYIL